MKLLLLNSIMRIYTCLSEELVAAGAGCSPGLVALEEEGGALFTPPDEEAELADPASIVAPGKAGKAEESSSKLSDFTIEAADGSSSSSGLFCRETR